jgi:hypothetical protein
MGSSQEYLRTNFYISMNKTTLAHLLERAAGVTSCPGIPVETARPEVTPEQIEDLLER